MKCVCKSCSVVSNSLWPHGLYSPWNSLGQNTGVGSLSPLQGIFQPRDQTQVSCIAGRFFTSWATREAQEYLIIWGDKLITISGRRLLPKEFLKNIPCFTPYGRNSWRVWMVLLPFQRMFTTSFWLIFAKEILPTDHKILEFWIGWILENIYFSPFLEMGKWLAWGFKKGIIT